MPLRILDTDKVISLDDKYIVWLKYSTGRLQGDDSWNFLNNYSDSFVK